MSIQKQIPNIFTLLNLFCGCIAIVLILQTQSYNFINDGEATTFSLPENIRLGAIFIFIAAIIDFLDGFVARLLNATSPLGAQLDSLSDVVSFGVAPSCILYQLLKSSYFSGSSVFDVKIIWLLPVFIFALAGAYRLARFNTDNTQSTEFKGLPIPAAGLIVASIPLIMNFTRSQFVYSIFENKFFIYILSIFLSCLMVSKLPLMAIKFKNFKFSDNKLVYILLAVSLLSIITLKWLSVPIIFLLYIIISIVNKKFIKNEV